MVFGGAEKQAELLKTFGRDYIVQFMQYILHKIDVFSKHAKSVVLFGLTRRFIGNLLSIRLRKYKVVTLHQCS